MVSHFHCYDPNCPGDHSGREIRAAEGQRPSSGGTAGAGRGAIGALATDPQRARLFLGSSCVALGTLRPCPPHVSEVKTQLHIRPRDTLFPSTKAFPRVDLGLRAASAMWGPKIESRGRRPLWPVPRGKTTGRNSGLELQWCSRRGVLPYHHRHLTHRTGRLLLPDTREGPHSFLRTSHCWQDALLRAPLASSPGLCPRGLGHATFSSATFSRLQLLPSTMRITALAPSRDRRKGFLTCLQV